jgi:hypothetical protein
MTDLVSNIAKGAAAEKARDDATAFGVLLLKANEAESTLKDRATVALILSNGSTEADFTNYARKTGITATLTVDNVNDRVDLDMPDQTWTTAGGATNNTLTKAVVYYQESAADSGRVPITIQDFAVTTDASDLTAQVAAAGFFRAS